MCIAKRMAIATGITRTCKKYNLGMVALDGNSPPNTTWPRKSPNRGIGDGEVVADARGRGRELVERQRVAGVGRAHREGREAGADDPVRLPRFRYAPVKYTRSM